MKGIKDRNLLGKDSAKLRVNYRNLKFYMISPLICFIVLLIGFYIMTRWGLRYYFYRLTHLKEPSIRQMKEVVEIKYYCDKLKWYSGYCILLTRKFPFLQIKRMISGVTQ